MDLQTRKIEFIQEFLKIKNERVILKLETLLENEVKLVDSTILEVITDEELNQRINQSESDFENKRFKTSAELLVKYQ